MMERKIGILQAAMPLLRAKSEDPEISCHPTPGGIEEASVQPRKICHVDDGILDDEAGPKGLE